MSQHTRRRPVPPAQRIGQRFGLWTITGVAGYLLPHHMHFQCRCDCGHESVIPSSNLYCGLSTKCRGCADREASRVHQARRTQRIRRAGLSPVQHPSGGVTAACVKCSRPLSRDAVRVGTRLCIHCGPRPAWKYPFSITEIGKANGVSKQAVSDYIQRNGWEAAARFYRMPGVPQ